MTTTIPPDDREFALFYRLIVEALQARRAAGGRAYRALLDRDLRPALFAAWQGGRLAPGWLTYDEAIAQLNRGPEEDRARVETTMGEACAVILDHLKAQGDPTWMPDTVPLHIKAATKLMLGHLYEHRGDDMRLDEELWAAVDRLLMRSRDPALA